MNEFEKQKIAREIYPEATNSQKQKSNDELSAEAFLIAHKYRRENENLMPLFLLFSVVLSFPIFIWIGEIFGSFFELFMPTASMFLIIFSSAKVYEIGQKFEDEYGGKSKNKFWAKLALIAILILFLADFAAKFTASFNILDFAY